MKAAGPSSGKPASRPTLKVAVTLSGKYTNPEQLGPQTAIRFAAAIRCNSSCRPSPSPPTSANPELMMAAALAPLAPASSRAWGSAGAGQSNDRQIHLTWKIRHLRETRHPRSLGIPRIDRIDITGVAKLTEETEGTVAKLILLGRGADQRHRTGMKQFLEVHRLFHCLLHTQSFRSLRKLPAARSSRKQGFARANTQRSPSSESFFSFAAVASLRVYSDF